MKTSIWVFAALVSMTGAVWGQSAPPPVVIEGLVRDISCPIQNHSSTATDFNLQCALDCARAGSPLVILTKSGRMYVPMSKAMPDVSVRKRLLPFVGKFVKVTGVVYALHGTQAISIEKITEDKSQHLTTTLPQ